MPNFSITMLFILSYFISLAWGNACGAGVLLTLFTEVGLPYGSPTSVVFLHPTYLNDKDEKFKTTNVNIKIIKPDKTKANGLFIANRFGKNKVVFKRYWLYAFPCNFAKLNSSFL